MASGVAMASGGAMASGSNADSVAPAAAGACDGASLDRHWLQIHERGGRCDALGLRAQARRRTLLMRAGFFMRAGFCFDERDRVGLRKGLRFRRRSEGAAATITGAATRVGRRQGRRIRRNAG